MADTHGITALVTGANRGLGLAFVDALLEDGALRVYAGMRNLADAPPIWADDPRVIAVELDVTDADEVAAAARACHDIDLLVSNAGITCVGPVGEKDEATARAVMEVNYFGPLRLTKAFAAGFEAKRGGIIYVLSMAAMIPPGPAPIYSASKSASAMFAAGVEADLGQRGVRITLSFPGFVDTRMSDGFTSRKASPTDIARATLAAWHAGESHVFPDDYSRLVLDHMRRDGARILLDPNAVRREMLAEHDRVPADS